MIIDRIYGLLAVLINCKYEDVLSWFQSHDGMWILAFLLKMVRPLFGLLIVEDLVEERTHLNDNSGSNLLNGCSLNSHRLHGSVRSKARR